MTTVRELMQTDVVTVQPGSSVRELARLLLDNSIHGAPVVDDGGRVIGVVSSTDLIRVAAEEGLLSVDADIRRGEASPFLPGSAPGGAGDEESEAGSAWFVEGDAGGFPLDPWLFEEPMDERTVAEIMTPVHFTIEPDAPVEELAEFLLRGRIHRAVVTEDDRLVGIVSAFDVLKAVAGRV